MLCFVVVVFFKRWGPSLIVVGVSLVLAPLPLRQASCRNMIEECAARQKKKEGREMRVRACVRACVCPQVYLHVRVFVTVCISSAFTTLRKLRRSRFERVLFKYIYTPVYIYIYIYIYIVPGWGRANSTQVQHRADMHAEPMPTGKAGRNVYTYLLHRAERRRVLSADSPFVCTT